MIVAHLYLEKDGPCIKTISFNHDRAERFIRICSHCGYIPFVDVLEQHEVSVNPTIGVYELWEPIMEQYFVPSEYPRNWKYVFKFFEDGYNRNRNLSNDAFNVGFREPDENVNLDKLKVKFKSSKELKSHLLNFLRR